MRSKCFFASAAALALVFSAVAVAQGPGPKATGGVTWENTDRGFTGKAAFTAQPAKGGGAKGRVNVRVTGSLNFEYKGDVTCYRQVGNYATFGGRITETSGPDADNDGFFQVWVLDGGEGSTSPDRIQTDRVAGNPNCSRNQNPPVQQVTDGNLQVHDAG